MSIIILFPYFFYLFVSFSNFFISSEGKKKNLVLQCGGFLCVFVFFHFSSQYLIILILQPILCIFNS